MKFKKVLAVVLSSVMIMGMSVTTFAATNTTISVDNAEAAEVYYLRIVEPDTTSQDGWKYVEAYEKDFANIPITTLTSLGETERTNNDGNNNYYATHDKLNNLDAYESSELAEALDSIKEDVKTDGKKVNGKSFTVTDPGLYVLIPEKTGYTYSPTLVYVPVDNETNITVDVKGSEDQIEKKLVNVTEAKVEGGEDTVIDCDDTVAAGDTVEYKVTIEYPYITDNYEDPSFMITDTLEGATFVENSLSVSVGGQPYIDYDLYEEDKETPLTTIKGKRTIVLKFKNYDPTKAGQKIELTYSALVDSDVSDTNPLKNTAYSELTLTPGGTPIKTNSIVISDPVKVEIHKVDADAAEKTLPGSVFALYTYEGTFSQKVTGTFITAIADADKLEDITLPTGYSSTNVTADGTADGNIVFNGLDANKQYYVVEIVAPEGYHIDGTKYQLISGGRNGDPIVTTENAETGDTNGDGYVTTTTEYKYNDFSVGTDGNHNITNTKLSSLPSTGGIGTTIFTIGGCVIMISAAGLYFASRRRQENK